MNKKELIAGIFETILKLLLLVLAIVLIYRLAVGAYDYGYRIFGEPAVSGEPGISMRITITQDDTPEQIGQALEDAGLIRDASLFRVVERLSDRELLPGSYELSTAMTIEEMIEAMSQETTEEDS